MAKQKQQPTSFHIPGNFIRQTFAREYKAKGNSEVEAVAKFEALIKSGEIEFVREWNGIKIYQFKK
jgi:hypothetical protein